MPAETEDVGILVVSCDAYGDLWAPFFGLFDKYWPDCPYPVYLGANRRRFEHPGVRQVFAWPDRSWSASLRAQLEQVPHAYILLLLEDYLIDRPVDTERVRRLARTAVARDAACLRLFPIPGPPETLADDPEVGELPRGSPYRASCMAALWNRQDLLALLDDAENAWQFENNGTERSNAFARPFLSVARARPWPINYYLTGVDRGVWLRPAVRLCRREGVPVDLAARRVETRSRQFRRSLLMARDLVRGLFRRSP